MRPDGDAVMANRVPSTWGLKPHTSKPGLAGSVFGSNNFIETTSKGVASVEFGTVNADCAAPAVVLRTRIPTVAANASITAMASNAILPKLDFCPARLLMVEISVSNSCSPWQPWAGAFVGDVFADVNTPFVHRKVAPDAATQVVGRRRPEAPHQYAAGTPFQGCQV